MKDAGKKNAWTMLLLSALFFFVAFSSPAAAQTNGTGHNGIIQKYLATRGLQASIISLDRTDGFDKAFSIHGPGNQNLLVGFNQSTEGRDGLFLIVKDGAEAIVSAAGDGIPQLVQADVTIDLGYILCVIDAVLAVVSDSTACNAGTGDKTICNAQAILRFITTFLNCGQPATAVIH
ncbi:MAG: hypothetical protein WCQ99_05310 [Pseudomonadota bacterium]